MITVSLIINIILAIAIGILTAWGVYKATNGNIYQKVVILIKEANKLDIIGSEKMEQVVNQLYEIVPAPYKKLLNKETLRKLAQKVYNAMKSFSQTEENK